MKKNKQSRSEKAFKDADDNPSILLNELVEQTSMSNAKLWLQQNPIVAQLLNETREGKVIKNELRHRGMFENPSDPHWRMTEKTKLDFENRMNIFGYHDNNDITFYLEVLDAFPNNEAIRQGLNDIKNNRDMSEKNKALLEKLLGITKSTAQKETEYMALEDFALQYNYADLFYKKLREKYTSLSDAREALPHQNILDRFKQGAAHFERAWTGRTSQLETIHKKIIQVRIPFENRKLASKATGVFDIFTPELLESKQRSQPVVAALPDKKNTAILLTQKEFRKIDEQERLEALKYIQEKKERQDQERQERQEQMEIMNKQIASIDDKFANPEKYRIQKRISELKQKISEAEFNADIDNIKNQLDENLEGLSQDIKDRIFKQVPAEKKRLTAIAQKIRTEAEQEIAELELALKENKKPAVHHYNAAAHLAAIQARDQAFLNDPKTTMIHGIEGLEQHNRKLQADFNRQIALAVAITAAVVIAAVFVAVAIFAPPAIAVLGPLAWKGLMLGIGAAASFLTGLGTYFTTKKALAPVTNTSSTHYEGYPPPRDPPKAVQISSVSPGIPEKKVQQAPNERNHKNNI